MRRSKSNKNKSKRCSSRRSKLGSKRRRLLRKGKFRLLKTLRGELESRRSKLREMNRGSIGTKLSDCCSIRKSLGLIRFSRTLRLEISRRSERRKLIR